MIDGVVTFALELHVPRSRAACLAELEARAQTAADELSRTGTPVRYLRALYLPEDETCFLLAEAGSQPAAALLSERAGLDSIRIVEAALPRSHRRESARTRSDNSRLTSEESEVRGA
jgi:hypothetical protein